MVSQLAIPTTLQDQGKGGRIPVIFNRSANVIRAKKPRFLINLRFQNNLPEVPSDPKMLLPPLNPEALTEFNLTSLEREKKKDMLLEHDLGIPITMGATERYFIPRSPPPLHPADASLLIDTANNNATPGAQGGIQNKKNTKDHNVSWLMRTKYITNELNVDSGAVAGNKRLAAVQQQHRASMRADSSQLDELDKSLYRDKLIAEIDKSFIEAHKPPVHPTKPELKAEAVLPLLPVDQHEEEEKRLILGILDSDPKLDVLSGDVGKLKAMTQREKNRTSAAFQLKSLKHELQDGKSEAFVGLLVPRRTAHLSSTSTADSKEPVLTATDIAGDYDVAREFAHQVKNDERMNTFLLRLDNKTNTAWYTDLSTRIILRKRKRTGDETYRHPEKIVVSYLEPGGGEDEGGDGEQMQQGATEAAAAAAAAIRDAFGSDDD